MKLTGATSPMRSSNIPPPTSSPVSRRSGLTDVGQCLGLFLLDREFRFFGLRFGNRRNLRRWRGPCNFTGMNDRRSADHIVFHVLHDDAVLFRRQVAQHVTDIRGVERG